MVPEGIASTAPGFRNANYQPHPIPNELNSLPRIRLECFDKSSRRFWCSLKFWAHQIRIIIFYPTHQNHLGRLWRKKKCPSFTADQLQWTLESGQEYILKPLLESNVLVLSSPQSLLEVENPDTTCWIRICIFNKMPGWFIGTLRFENHLQR